MYNSYNKIENLYNYTKSTLNWKAIVLCISSPIILVPLQNALKHIQCNTKQI